MDLHIDDLNLFHHTKNVIHELDLKDNGIVFRAWEDQYLFELLSEKIAQKLSRRYRVDTISKLRSCSEEYIESMPSAILPSVKAVLVEYQN